MNQTTQDTAPRMREETTLKPPVSLQESGEGAENVLLTLMEEATAGQVRPAAQETARLPRPFTHD